VCVQQLCPFDGLGEDVKVGYVCIYVSCTLCVHTGPRDPKIISLSVWGVVL